MKNYEVLCSKGPSLWLLQALWLAIGAMQHYCRLSQQMTNFLMYVVLQNGLLCRAIFVHLHQHQDIIRANDTAFIIVMMCYSQRAIPSLGFSDHIMLMHQLKETKDETRGHGRDSKAQGSLQKKVATCSDVQYQQIAHKLFNFLTYLRGCK